MQASSCWSGPAQAVSPCLACRGLCQVARAIAAPLQWPPPLPPPPPPPLTPPLTHHGALTALTGALAPCSCSSEGSPGRSMHPTGRCL